MLPKHPQPIIAFHDLRYGSTKHVPRNFVHPAARELERIIPASHECGHSLLVDGTPFALYSDLTTLAEGNAYFFLCSGDSPGGGVVPENKLLFEGVTACELATAPEVWRPIMRYYLRTVAKNPPLFTFSAPGPMPKSDLPWVAFFCTPTATCLPSEERNSLIAIAKAAGIALLVRCQQGIRSSRAAGREFRLDPEEYPELLIDSED
jgi:hypothetical protein